MPVPTIVLDNLVFPEGPRWHDGRLWFSDMHAREVVAVDMQGLRETICTVANQPSGLGWLPDGRLLVVSMTDRKLLRGETDGTLVDHAELSGVASFHCNDMVVDARGNAYVGNFGFDLHAGAEPAAAALALVRPDGRVETAAEGLLFPNGAVITPDDGTLIVAESGARKLTAFSIAADGTLGDRRTWAEVPGPPDGICFDDEGCIWAAVPRGNAGVYRIAEGGEVRQQVALDGFDAFACMLGGSDGRTLFICEAKTSDPEAIAGPGNGRITSLRVDAARAGLP